MGNVSHKEQWVVQQRLRCIEQWAWWSGMINRSDLAKHFGLSLPQVSADLQLYQEMNPKALRYNLRNKRYEATPEMPCVVHEPRLEEGMALFLPGGERASTGKEGTTAKNNPTTGMVEVLQLPQRRRDGGVERRLFLATLHGRRVRIKYRSLNRGKVDWRLIEPKAWAHDGIRWHVRAWCERNEEYRDFALSRVVAADWPSEAALTTRPPDTEWDTVVTLRVRPHRELSPEQKKILAQDYELKNGVMVLRVRQALEDYLRTQLHLPLRNQRAVVAKWELADLPKKSQRSGHK